MNISKEQLDDFIDSIFFENFGVMFPREHIFFEHFNVSDDYLKSKAKNQSFHKGILQVISRFYPELSKQEIINLVLSCLKDNQEKIIDWQKNDPRTKKEIIFCCHKQIGEGIVLGADWNQKIPFSNICVVLTPPHGNNLFDVLTAYPCPNIDEADKCWTARREWAKRRQNSSKRHSR